MLQELYERAKQEPISKKEKILVIQYIKNNINFEKLFLKEQKKTLNDIYKNNPYLIKYFFYDKKNYNYYSLFLHFLINEDRDKTIDIFKRANLTSFKQLVKKNSLYYIYDSENIEHFFDELFIDDNKEDNIIKQLEVIKKIGIKVKEKDIKHIFFNSVSYDYVKLFNYLNKEYEINYESYPQIFYYVTTAEKNYKIFIDKFLSNGLSSVYKINKEVPDSCPLTYAIFNNYEIFEYILDNDPSIDKNQTFFRDFTLLHHIALINPEKMFESYKKYKINFDVEVDGYKNFEDFVNNYTIKDSKRSILKKEYHKIMSYIEKNKFNTINGKTKTKKETL